MAHRIVRMRRRRQLLSELQGKRCAGCGGLLDLNIGGKSPRRPTLDEVIPRSRGGGRVLGNQLLMHLGCNAKKGHRLPTGCELIWLELVNARLAERLGRAVA